MKANPTQTTKIDSSDEMVRDAIEASKNDADLRPVTASEAETMKQKARHNQTIKLGYFEFKNLKPWLEVRLSPQSTYIELNHGSYVVGRGKQETGVEKDQIFIKDDTISQRHCRLIVANNQIKVSDLDSTNGCALIRRTGEYINLRSRKNVPIVEGDRFMIGSVECHIQMLSEDPTKTCVAESEALKA
ncbi:MAG: FHA domain-containing protein [Verrucomicrobiota bacterium]